MFYDRYVDLCKRNNEKPYVLAVKLGAKSNSVVAQWKKGSAPRAELLQKIAEYFGVSVGYLLTGETPAEPTGQGEELTTEQIFKVMEQMSLSELNEVMAHCAEVTRRRLQDDIKS